MNIELWKKRKKELNLTHDKLAEMSGISRRTIAGIFSNDERYASPTLTTITAIEKALGLQNEERAQGISDYVNTPLTANESEFLNLYRDIGDKYGTDRQKTVLKLLEAILDET